MSNPDNPYDPVTESDLHAGWERATCDDPIAADQDQRSHDTNPLGPWSTDCDDIPAGYQLPDSYDVDANGVFALKEVKEGQQRIRVAYEPLLPVGVYVDPAGNQMLELVWKDRDKWKNRVVSRSTAKSGRKLIAALGDAGLPAVDADAKPLERWLAAVEACNRWRIPRRELARWLGWQPDGTFVTSNGAPRRIEPAYDDQAGAIGAHHEQGTLDGWQQAVKKIEPYPVAKVSAYVGFAAALLHVVGVDSFTVDISGRSTRGKTTAAKIGLSVWADPAEKGDGLFSWRTTLIGIEKRLNVCRGLPVVIDETRVVKVPELIDQVVYQIPKNHGQARGGGWPNLLPWSTIVISTGEQSALSFTTHQGAAARVLSLARSPFGDGGSANGQAAADVGRGVDENYGVAGPVFIERLQQQLKQPHGRDHLRQRHQDLTDKCKAGKDGKGCNDMSGRRAPMVAVLILAAELVHSWGIVPFTPLSVDEWLDLLTIEELTDNRPEMALEVVREYVASNPQALWEPNKNGVYQPATGWIGRRIDVDGVTTVALLPERLRDALKRASYSLDAVLPGWIELNYLVASGKGRNRYQTPRNLGGGNTRMYVFNPGPFLNKEGDDK